MLIEVICTGDEVLTGKIVNTTNGSTAFNSSTVSLLKVGTAGLTASRSTAARVTLGPQRLFEVVGERGVFRHRALSDGGIQVGYRAQPQSLT